MIGSERTIVDTILEQVQKNREEYTKLFLEIKALVKDKSIPLDIRWKLFEEFSDGEELLYIPNFPIILGIKELEGEIYWEKKETFTIHEFLDLLYNSLYENNNIIEKAYMLFKEDREPTNEELEYIIENDFMPEFKEWILNNFLYKFTFDW